MRSETMLTKPLAARALALMGGVLIASCNPGVSTNLGTLRLALKVPPNGPTVSAVQWQILASDGTTVLRSGTVNTSDPNATASVDTSCPAGKGNKAVLTATASDGTHCSGMSAPFNVTAGAAVMVGVQLVCGGGSSAQNNGSVIVDGTFVNGDNCPGLTSWVAAPLATSMGGGKIDVAVTATDADSADVLTYFWTSSPSTEGSFAMPTAAMTQFTCGAPGPQTLMVVVSDNHQPTPCTATMSFPVTCSGGGFCGNGLVEPGEQCDPPNTATCDSMCRLKGFCGNGVVESGEQCEPPNTATCNSVCHLITPPKCSAPTACSMCEQGAANSSACEPAELNVRNQPAPSCSGCDGFLPNTAAVASCNALLSCLRTKPCFFGDFPTSCYCGTRMATDCMTMGAPTDAPCYNEYTAAAVGFPGGVFSQLFDPTTPVGIADNTAVCDNSVCTSACPVEKCGNGLVEAGEQCDPPNGTTCDSTCRRIAMCGNSIVEPGEQCDPPNGTTCDSTCKFINPNCSAPTACTTCERNPINDGVCSANYLLTVPGQAGLGCFGCDGFLPNITAVANCNALLSCIRSTKCAQGDDPTACYCGGLLAANCVTMGAPTTAPCYNEYTAAAMGFPGNVFTQFFDPTTPAGIANNTLSCDVDASCPCFGGGTCGDGVVDPGETCEPPNTTTCDSKCHVISVCGNNVVEPGEQCDPPNGTTCTSTCRLTPVCGNSIVEAGEQCDPPNGTTCDSTCQIISTTPRTCSPASSCTRCEQDPAHADVCPPESLSVPSQPAPACFGCDGFLPNITAVANCNALLSCIRSTKCAQGDDPTACYCGPLVAGVCVTQGAPATAPCYNEYTAAAVGFPGNVFTQFFDPTTPAGIANNTLSCDADAPCTCP
jgi:hypothetical protein